MKIDIFKIVVLMFFSLSIMALSCQTSKKEEGKIQINEEKSFEIPDVYKLDLEGENIVNDVNSSGNKILLQSRERKAHRYWQIYEFDKDKSQLNRLTYHYGDAFWSRFVNQNQFLYTSITDEIKDNPEELKKLNIQKSVPLKDWILEAKLGGELYVSHFFDRTIKRLTAKEGLDAGGCFLNSEDYVYWGLINNKFQIFRNKQKSQALFLPSSQHQIGLTWDGQSKLAWMEVDAQYRSHTDSQGGDEKKDNAHSQIDQFEVFKIELIVYDYQNKAQLKKILLPQGFYRDLNWWKGTKLLGVVFQKFKEEKSILLALDFEKECFYRILNVSGEFRFPVFSSSSEILFFSSAHTGSYQIYSKPMTLDKDLKICHPLSDLQVKMTK